MATQLDTKACEFCGTSNLIQARDRFCTLCAPIVANLGRDLAAGETR